MLGAADWVFSGRGEECRMRHTELSAAAHDAQDAIDSLDRTSALAASALLAVFAGVVLWWGATRFGGARGGDANWIAAFALGLFPLMESFAALSSAAIRANGHRVSIEQLNSLPDADDSTEVPEVVAPDVASFDLAAERLRFGYRKDAPPVLDGISMRVPAGQKLAILGQSGSGKSTFAALLRGDLQPDSGSVSLGGVSTMRFGDAISGFVGIVQQAPYLFNQTVRDNLAIARPDATDEEIWNVLEQVQLADLMRKLPKGLSTMMAEAGMRFSGGERHRIALARVLLADTPIILLDEPTVGLDPDTERALIQTILDTNPGKTLIMITHHLQGIEGFDRVVFLEHGRIELDGSPAELAATNERYRQLLAFDGINGERA